MGERREEGGEGVVRGDAEGVEGGDLGEEMGMVGWVVGD